jgi:hypothetical protein
MTASAFSEFQDGRATIKRNMSLHVQRRKLLAR